MVGRFTCSTLTVEPLCCAPVEGVDWCTLPEWMVNKARAVGSVTSSVKYSHPVNGHLSAGIAVQCLVTENCYESIKSLNSDIGYKQYICPPNEY